jgi:hypothetical protein
MTTPGGKFFVFIENSGDIIKNPTESFPFPTWNVTNGTVLLKLELEKFPMDSSEGMVKSNRVRRQRRAEAGERRGGREGEGRTKRKRGT